MKPGSRSISAKLMWMNVVVSATVLVLAVLAFFFYDLISFRQNLIRSLITSAQIVGANSVSAMTFDDPQSTKDHIHPHRTPLVVVSPYAKPGYIGKRHYVSASIVKTEELLLGLPPNNYGDLFATDLRDLFQPRYNGIGADSIPFTRKVASTSSPEGRRIWSLASRLDTSAPDRDSRRLGELARLSARADDLHGEAGRKGALASAAYLAEQERLYRMAEQVTEAPMGRDADD